MSGTMSRCVGSDEVGWEPLLLRGEWIHLTIDWLDYRCCCRALRREEGTQGVTLSVEYVMMKSEWRMRTLGLMYEFLFLTGPLPPMRSLRCREECSNVLTCAPSVMQDHEKCFLGALEN